MFRSRESLSAFESLETSFPQAKTTKSYQQSGVSGDFAISISRVSEVSGVSEISRVSCIFLVLRIAGPVMIHACPAQTQQIAIIDCIFWFHSRASNFQQVWEKKGAEPQCNIAFFCKWFPQSMWL